jgi:pyridoxal phosphate phosphatase PHOSPHO2
MTTNNENDISNINTLIIFDFDWSLVNENSDTWIIESLDRTLYDEMKIIRSHPEFKGQWTKLMDLMVGKLMLERGFTKEHAAEALCNIPIFQETIEAIKLAFTENNVTLTIISDANEFYISTILKHINILHMFDRIVTNPSQFTFNEEVSREVLRIFPYQPMDAPHNCQFCPTNLCKGGVLRSWIDNEYQNVINESTRIVYIGDGHGDFCPALHLRTGDVLLCRKDWTLHKEVNENPNVKAKIVPWSTGSDILREFQLILFGESSI